MAHNHFNTTRVWPVYSGPACYYTGSVGVGIRAVAARFARELVACRGDLGALERILKRGAPVE